MKFSMIKRNNNGMVTVCDFLSFHTGISKTRIKDAMNKGAVWIKRKREERKIVRRASAILTSGDTVELYYDEDILNIDPPKARCIKDFKRYSVWYKPAGLLTQPTNYGDHCSLLRQAQTSFNPKRKTYPVHRLDREASGLVLIAHDKNAADEFSRLFRENRIIKHYRVDIRGNPSLGGQRTINLLLDGKPAITDFTLISYDAEKDVSSLDVIIRTGRLHQIRRHFDMIGFPVIGDPIYGKNNKNTEGLRIVASSLKFFCPILRQDMEFCLDES